MSRTTHLTDANLLALGANTDVEDRAVHCSECRQLDYLPIQCACTKHLCSECTSYHTHNCADYIAARDAAVRLKNRLAPKCTIRSCSATLLAPTVGFNASDGEWAAAVQRRVGTHVESGCKLFVYALSTEGIPGQHGNNSAKALKVKVKGPRCKAKGCKTRLAGTVNKATCSECDHDFCLRHRFGSDHACQGRGSTRTTGKDGAVASIFESCVAAAARLSPWAAAEQRRRHHLNIPV